MQQSLSSQLDQAEEGMRLGRLTSMCRWMKLHPSSALLTDVDLQWIKTLRPETAKLLEEYIGENLTDSGLGNDFLNMTTKAKTNK